MQRIVKFWTKALLWQQVMIGLVLGIVTGLIFQEKAVHLQPIGELFMRLIKMVIVPLIYISIVTAIINVEDTSKLTRITGKAVVLFLVTTTFAVALGLLLSHFLKPGSGLELESLGLKELHREASTNTFNITKIMKDIIPDNALNALVSGKFLQVVFFSFFTGFVINLLREQREDLVKVFDVGFKIVFKMIEVILKLAPYGAFGFSAAVVGTQGIAVLQSLGALILVFFLAILVQYIIFGVMIMFTGLSPMPFYKKSVEYQLIALSTSSSKATLATTMKVCRKLGVSPVSTSFVLPLGAAVNMDGLAIYLGICVLFFAQVYQIDLSVMDYIMIIFTSTLGSIGGAGIPSGSIIMLPMVLSAVNIPIDGIALIVGIDRILDMTRTTLNITGDATITLIVDKWEGTLNKKLYYSK
ncbi:MAG: dicarboxylate/amino acid:cation symporter [Rickettsiales bacterium]|nr:dicarboxylate/amino acid:cation symporter [Rickettsiales bacterium]